MKLGSIFRRLLPDNVSAEERFAVAYRANGFGGTESVSGPGSGLPQTEVIRREIPRILRSVGARTFVDCPCGDFHWMKCVDLPVEKYIGGDVVAELAAENQRRYGDARREFRPINLLTDELPDADVLLCRDCLVHLTDAEVRAALANIRRGDVAYLLTTTFPAQRGNRDLGSTRGSRPRWRPVNLQLPPYNFPAPLELINEGCTEKGGRFPDKSLGLWRVADLPDVAA
jgi:hypothetical protein